MGTIRRVYWDTMIFAYWLEGHRSFADRVQEIRESMQKRGDVLCSSPAVVAELMVGPVKKGLAEEAAALERYFLSTEVTMLNFTIAGTRLFAELRAQDGLQALDAMHLATATHAGVDVFLTNDKRLHKLRRPGLPFVTTLQTDLF